MAASGALGTALALVPVSANAASTPASTASGQFLSGSVGSINLARLAALQAASVQNSGSQSMQVSRDPLGVSALGATLINDPTGLQLNLGQVIDLGAANQYAQASNDGTSMASSGAVNNDGGIGVGKVGSAVDGNATVDLDSLLGTKYASVIGDLKLSAQAVSAQATGALTKASGSYDLAGLTLTLTSPAIAGLTSRVDSALAPLDAQIASLDGPTGKLAGAVSSVVTGINPILNLAGADASVNAAVAVNLPAAVAPLLTGTYGDNGVSFNLQTGVVTVDLATLLGGDINSEPAGTEVLSDTVVNKILNAITTTINTLAGQIVTTAENALDNAAVNVDATLNTSTAQAPLLGQTCVSNTTGVTTGGGLLGGLLGGTTGGLLNGLLCTPTTSLLPALKTNLAVHIHGTVDQLVSGTAPAATAAATVLGIPVAVNLNSLTTGVGNILHSDLLTNASGTAGLSNALDTNLVDPAVTGLLGSGTSVDSALTKVLSVKLNNQSVSGGTFTETALNVTALPDGTNSLATVKLASASVGPNATTIVPTDPGSPSNPGDPGTPTSPANPSNPGGPTTSGNPSTPTTTAALGDLAFTGTGIAGLVGAILALLAAGAYLVREGYRRNGRRQIP